MKMLTLASMVDLRHQHGITPELTQTIISKLAFLSMLLKNGIIYRSQGVEVGISTFEGNSRS